jgi:hypothetical protein
MYRVASDLLGGYGAHEGQGFPGRNVQYSSERIGGGE